MCEPSLRSTQRGRSRDLFSPNESGTILINQTCSPQPFPSVALRRIDCVRSGDGVLHRDGSSACSYMRGLLSCGPSILAGFSPSTFLAIVDIYQSKLCRLSALLCRTDLLTGLARFILLSLLRLDTLFELHQPPFLTLLADRGSHVPYPCPFIIRPAGAYRHVIALYIFFSRRSTTSSLTHLTPDHA